MTPDDPSTWWTAFGAIFQAVGAVATFAAVAVSLWVVFSERAMKASGSAGIRVMFAGDGSPGTYMVGVEVVNIGTRAFQVTSVGWRTGWVATGPDAIRFRYAIQNTSVMQNQRPAPHIVEPGRSEGYYSLIEDMKRADQGDSKAYLFERRIPVLGLAPIKAMVHITGRKPLFVNVSQDLAAFLRTNDHRSTTDD